MKIDGACTCGSIRIEGEADPEDDQRLPLHRLPDRDRNGVPRLDPGEGRQLQGHRRADDLHQDHGRQRQSARAGILPEMRLAALFDHARRGAAGDVHRARRHAAPARSARCRSGRSGGARRGTGSPGSTPSARSKSRPEPRMRSAKIVVCGAGIAGVAAAWQLTLHGASNVTHRRAGQSALAHLGQVDRGLPQLVARARTGR